MSELRKLKGQLDQKFEELKKELQDNCLHDEVSDWMEEWWAPGHPTGYRVRECNRCGKEMAREVPEFFDELPEELGSER